jgi:hypothetical protein
MHQTTWRWTIGILLLSDTARIALHIRRASFIRHEPLAFLLEVFRNIKDGINLLEGNVLLTAAPADEDSPDDDGEGGQQSASE